MLNQYFSSEKYENHCWEREQTNLALVIQFTLKKGKLIEWNGEKYEKSTINVRYSEENVPGIIEKFIHAPFIYINYSFPTFFFVSLI